MTKREKAGRGRSLQGTQRPSPQMEGWRRGSRWGPRRPHSIAGSITTFLQDLGQLASSLCLSPHRHSDGASLPSGSAGRSMIGWHSDIVVMDSREGSILCTSYMCAHAFSDCLYCYFLCLTKPFNFFNSFFILPSLMEDPMELRTQSYQALHIQTSGRWREGTTVYTG